MGKSGGIVVDNDIVIPELRNIIYFIAVDIQLDKPVAVSQGVHIGDVVIVHVDVGDLIQTGEIINAGKGIVGTVNYSQSAAFRPLGKGNSL